jgi:hypothetical protein
MDSIAERLAALSPEKRRLFELMNKQKRAAAGEATPPASNGHDNPDPASGTRQEKEAHPRTEPFSLVSADDRLKLPDDVEDAYPVTKMQAGMLYHMEQTPEYLLYHNVDSISLRVRFDEKAFEQAVNRVVARHPVLRTSFDLTSYSEPLQLVHRTARLEPQVVDVRRLPPNAQDEIVSAYAESEKRRRFDLSRAPLLRFCIHRRADDVTQITLTEFHPILDGWSLNTVQAGIFANYFALLNGEELPDEPPLSASSATSCCWSEWRSSRRNARTTGSISSRTVLSFNCPDGPCLAGRRTGGP